MTGETEEWDDNPEWTAQDFALARPASEILPPEIVAQLVRQGSGRRQSIALEAQPPFARDGQLGRLRAA